MNTNEKPTEEPQQSAPTDQQDASMIQALQRENEELKTSIRDREAEYAIKRELESAGARSPNILTEFAKAKLQFDSEGKIVNSAAIVDGLRKEFPEQFGTDRFAGSIDGGAGAIPKPALSKESLARMSPAEIAKLDWDAVRQVLSQS